jgi:MoxR-like ATPase
MSVIKQIIKDLENSFFERSEAIKAVARSILAEQHIALLGPPGVGKSMLITAFADRIIDANVFQTLLMKDSTPDEVTGPMSLKGLEEDKIRRNIEDMLPAADFAFLDEIFKANSVVLNSTLGIMNERKFKNDGKLIDCPLITLMAASNELPEEEELAALWDRFCVRLIVNKIKESSNFVAFLKTKVSPQKSAAATFGTLDDIRDEIEEVKKVTVSDKILEAMEKIRRELQAEKITPPRS